MCFKYHKGEKTKYSNNNSIINSNQNLSLKKRNLNLKAHENHQALYTFAVLKNQYDQVV